MIAFVPLLIISAIANVTPVEPTNLAQGAQYSFARPPSYEATSDANDRVQLTDGRFSSGQMWSSKEAVGWYAGAQPIVIDVDLSAVRALGQVCVRSARRQAAGVSFPASIDIFISNDGQEYGWVGDAAAGQDVSDGEYLSKYICSRELGQKARYVRLSVTAR
ncbi:MAG TPA: hypothetical protein VM120_27975, partial [Bryobacteraceae bacterium]|nr:hypothetical protein [Bryobacteraceae bacterium]